MIKDGDHGDVVRFQDLLFDDSMSNMEHVVGEMHDVLKAYYTVALKRFVDSICMQAADHHVITGPKTPLKLFSPSFVTSLSADQLAEIASEDPSLKRRRGNLKQVISDLEVGKKILT